MDLEIELLKAKQKIEDLENKLEENMDKLNAAREEATYYKNQFDRLALKPVVYSDSLNVSNSNYCL